MKSPVSIKPTTCLVALGGGRTGDGMLNQISRSRLEHAVSVAQAERVEKIIAVGGYRANFRESSLIFDVSTAAVHRGFYRDAGLRDENIVLAECGFDTLTEALCVFSPVLMQDLKRFNGGLFEDADALPLNTMQLGLLIVAAEADWKQVEPAIFGTLLERALDKRQRHKLGAHYTPRA